ncbi:MAG: hypothetical protein ACJ763_13425 [Bdellovibrionia bacterium]
MRTFILIAAALLIQQQANAAVGICDNRVDLVCEAKFNKPDGASVSGPTALGRVYDQTNALFAPVDCQGSIVLDTYAGQFTASYKDYEGIVTAYFEPIEGKKRLVILADPIDLATKTSVTVTNLSDERYDSLTFTCYTQVNYQYRYRHNPNE